MSKVGIEIGGTKLQIVVGDPLTGDMFHHYRLPVNPSQGAKGILRQIESTLADLEEMPTTIAIGFGGPVNRSTGVVATSHQIDGWAGFALMKWFKEKYRVPVIVENDANTAALAEAVYGAGKDYSHVFYVTLGSGVGGGMVVNRKLYHGTEPGEAEIGLMHLDPNGNTFESFCSGWSLNKAIREQLLHLPDHSVLKQSIDGDEMHESNHLLPALEKNDPAAIRIFEDYTNNLAWGLSHIVPLFNPQVIILGGGVSKIGEPLRKEVEKKLPKHLVTAYQSRTKILLSKLGEAAVPMGTLCLMQTHVKSASSVVGL